VRTELWPMKRDTFVTLSLSLSLSVSVSLCLSLCLSLSLSLSLSLCLSVSLSLCPSCQMYLDGTRHGGVVHEGGVDESGEAVRLGAAAEAQHRLESQSGGCRRRVSDSTRDPP
jgi:hypothetical protein